MGLARQSILAAAVCLASTAFTADAAPLKWTLTDATSLGSSITGSFVYDADTSTYSHINITTSAGSVISAGSWNTLSNAAMYPPSFFVQLVDTTASDQSGANVLGLMFYHSLTNAGGTVNLYATYQGSCLTAACGTLGAYPGDPTSGFNWNITGYLVASAIPEPASLSVLAAGAGAIFLTRKRRTRRVASA